MKSLTTAVLLSTLIISPHSAAHLLKVFATVQGDTVTGKVYFAGGAALEDTSVKASNMDTGQAYTTRTDHEGRFVFKLPLVDTDYRITADTQDGHRAHWQVQANQSAAAKPSNYQVKSSSQDIEHIVARAVSAQIQPLQEQLNAAQERAKFQDILGALGYIAGIFGLWSWWRQRR